MRRSGGGQGRAQSLLFVLVEGAADYRAAVALQGGQDLVGRHLADQQEQRGIAGLQALRGIPHEPVVDADIGQRAAEAPDAAPIAAPANGIRKIIPISAPQNPPETAPDAVGLKD